MPAPLLRSNVLAAKDRLAQERAKLKQQHDASSPGIQVCARLTDMLDHVVLDLYQSALEDLPDSEKSILSSEVALVAHGGYGRRDVAPYSDVDLMLLCSPKAARNVTPLAKRLLHDLYDAGLILGQSVRTISEACKLGLRDATIFTSLVESRLLTGSESLFSRFQTKFQVQARRHWRTLVRDIENSRREERERFGETVYLLEPNVKRSPGGLRDIQLMRWVGFARYGEATPDGLLLLDKLSKEDELLLRRALEFLLRVRNELHFYSQKEQDVLGRSEQVRLAKAFGANAARGMLEVEVFMREYFRNTHAVQQVAARFLEGAQPWTKLGDFFSPLLSHKVDGDYRVGPKRISATPAGLAKLQGNLTEILRLADLANSYNKRIAHHTWEAVHRAAPQPPDVLTSEATGRFMSILEHPARLGELLRDLHALGVLECLIPDFAHARSLLQFNEYHKFTVDEHCIRAVEAATSFADTQTPWGEVYRSIKPKNILHLALLIHDLGKGYVEDHSEVGLRIAGETARRLGLPEHDAETLKFLVHKHLVMAHLAFRRDTSDDQLIVRFAVEVGSAEVLRSLFVLTCADLAAVGPGVLNSWKGEVLSDLYMRTVLHLSGDSPSLVADDCRATAQALLENDEPAEWFVQQTEALHSSYLMNTSPERIAEELRRLHRLGRGDADVWHRYVPETKTVEYTIGTYEDITPGIFHKLTGGLTSAGLQILSADINTLADGLVFDRFLVHDPDYADRPPPERMTEVERRLKDALHSDQPPVFRRIWRIGQQSDNDALQFLPTQVRLDNNSSDRFTIVDIFASDRMGLLYTISRTLFEQGLSLSLAKIGTYLDQVVDVFYVTDRAGQKIEDEQQLHRVRQALLAAIKNLQQEGSP